MHENVILSLEAEIANITKWARKNKTMVNIVETKKMAFHQSNPKLRSSLSN
jgi:hypothetical protein